MPLITKPVKESFLTVGRPVVKGIIADLLQQINIPSNVKVYFPDGIEEDAQIGSREGVNEDLGKFPGANKLTVNVSESYNLDLINTAPVTKPETQFIFRDEALDLYIKPAYKYTDINISLVYRATDKVEVERWRDDIIARHSMMRDMFVHRVAYYYNLPNSFLLILKEIHRLREKVEPYGQVFEEYFWKNISGRATQTTNLNGTQFVPGIAETQDEIVGHFDIDGVPDIANKDGDQPSYSITIPYKFTYSKVIECVMRYPNVIHNQVLSTDYWGENKTIDTEKYNNHFSLSSGALFKMRQGKRLMQPNVSAGVSLPSWDEFITPYVSLSSIRIFTALTTRSEADKKTLLSLTDLGEYKLDDEIIAYLKNYYSVLSTPQANPFIITVYKNFKILSPSDFTVDSNLNISLNNDQSLRDTYRVRLGLVTDLLALNNNGIDELKKNPDIFNTIIDALKPGIGPITPVIDTYVGKKDYNDKAIEINKVITTRTNWTMVTVMNLILRACGST